MPIPRIGVLNMSITLPSPLGAILSALPIPSEVKGLLGKLTKGSEEQDVNKLDGQQVAKQAPGAPGTSGASEDNEISY